MYCTPAFAYEPLRVGSSFARHFKGRRRRRRRQWRQQSDMREPGRECAIDDNWRRADDPFFLWRDRDPEKPGSQKVKLPKPRPLLLGVHYNIF